MVLVVSGACPAFVPAKGLENPHAQTLYPVLFRRQSAPKMAIETFAFDDGDFTDCYWHYKQPEPESSVPIVTLFHGLQGSYRSPYIRGIMHTLAQAGFASVVMHFRGCSGRPNALARSYHSGDTADAKAWLRRLKHTYPKASLYAIGYSLGGNMLLKLVAEYGQNSPLKAAASVSAPLQLAVSARWLERGVSQLYQAYLLRDLKRALLEKYDRFDMQALIGKTKKEIGALSNFYAFDDAYTAPIHGFASADDYYARSSARQYLGQIKIPALIIQALDDPFMTPEVLPDPSALPKNVTLEVTRHGGHVGFVAGSIIRPEYWLEKRIICFFQKQQQ